MSARVEQDEIVLVFQRAGDTRPALPALAEAMKQQ